MTGYYLDAEQDAADIATRDAYATAAAHHGHDMRRHDDDRTADGSMVATWCNPASGLYGFEVLNLAGQPVAAGCGWLTEAEAMCAGKAVIRGGA